MHKTNQWLPYNETGVQGIEVTAPNTQLIGTTTTKTATDTPGVLANNGTRLRISVERTDALADVLVVSLFAQTVPGGGWTLVSTTGCPGPAGNTTIIAPPDSAVHAWRLEGAQGGGGIIRVRVGAVVTGT